MLGVKVHLIAQLLWSHIFGYIDDGVLERGSASYSQCSVVFVRFNSGMNLIDQLNVCGERKRERERGEGGGREGGREREIHPASRIIRKNNDPYLSIVRLMACCALALLSSMLIFVCACS